MYGRFALHENGGVNPPYSPAYPMEWEAKEVRRLEIVAAVDREQLGHLLSSTPFEQVGDRVAFQIQVSVEHTLALHTGTVFDLMVVAPVRYRDLFTYTRVHMYCSDSMGIAAGREIFGFCKKDVEYTLEESPDGAMSGWVGRRGQRLVDFAFTPNPDAPVASLVDGVEQPKGVIHVRRLPHPARPEPVYEDVVYRDGPTPWSAPTPGEVELRLHSSRFDPLADLAPRVLGAHLLTTAQYGGGLAVEDRRLLDRKVAEHM